MPVLLDGLAATGTSDSPRVGDSKSICIHVCSASTSTATVKIQQSLGGDKWHTVATITNPTLEGELWRGPSLPLTRVYVSAWTAGSISAFYDHPSGAEASSWAQIDATSPTSGSFGIIKYTWTNAEVVAAGTGGTSALITIGSLPANSQLISGYTIIGTQATFAAGTLTVGVGRTNPTYVDFLAAGDAKAAAATIYGNAAAERATDMAIQLVTAATPVKAIFTAGAGDLANVTTCTGTICLLYATLPL